MKKVVSVIVAIIMIIGIASISVGAQRVPDVIPPCYYGDVNCDDVVNVFDVTCIQMYLADFEKMDKRHQKIADVDNDGEITIFDATLIQQKLVQQIDEFPAGDELYFYFYVEMTAIDYEGMYPIVGEPVTFTFETSSTEDWLPYIYEYYVNDVLVCESTKNEFTYTFNEAGSYKVEARVRNAIDYEYRASRTVVVKES